MSYPVARFGGTEPKLTPSIERFLPSLRRSISAIAEQSDDPQIHSSVRIALEALKFTRSDTLAEAALINEALTLYNNRNSSIAEHVVNRTDFYELSETPAEREAIFFLIANIFNRGDALIEEALKNPINNPEEIVSLVFHKGLAAYDFDHHKRIPPAEVYRAAKTLAHFIGINVTSWDRYVTEIFEAQTRNLVLTNEMHHKGLHPFPYDVHDALRYRYATIGTYARWLAEIAYPNADIRNYFVVRALAVQAADDFYDMYEDVYTQMNPFTAFYAAHGLLDLSVHTATPEKTSAWFMPTQVKKELASIFLQYFDYADALRKVCAHSGKSVQDYLWATEEAVFLHYLKG